MAKHRRTKKNPTLETIKEIITLPFALVGFGIVALFDS